MNRRDLLKLGLLLPLGMSPKITNIDISDVMLDKLFTKINKNTKNFKVEEFNVFVDTCLNYEVWSGFFGYIKFKGCVELQPVKDKIMNINDNFVVNFQINDNSPSIVGFHDRWLHEEFNNSTKYATIEELVKVLKYKLTKRLENYLA